VDESRPAQLGSQPAINLLRTGWSKKVLIHQTKSCQESAKNFLAVLTFEKDGGIVKLNQPGSARRAAEFSAPQPVIDPRSCLGKTVAVGAEWQVEQIRSLFLARSWLKVSALEHPI